MPHLLIPIMIKAACLLSAQWLGHKYFIWSQLSLSLRQHLYLKLNHGKSMILAWVMKSAAGAKIRHLAGKITGGHAVSQGLVEAESFRFFSGLISWAPKQLALETSSGVWSVPFSSCDTTT